MSALFATVVVALASVLEDGPVPLHEPRLGGKESRHLPDCVTSTHMSSMGGYVNRFEADVEPLASAKRQRIQV